LRSGFFSSDANIRACRAAAGRALRAGISISLTRACHFLYNSGFSAFMPTEKEQGEPAPRLEAHISKQERTSGTAIFLDRS
jgi:hypothetical protein